MVGERAEQRSQGYPGPGGTPEGQGQHQPSKQEESGVVQVLYSPVFSLPGR